MDPKNPDRTNLEKTSESASRAKEKPLPGNKPEGIVEKPAQKRREEAAKEQKKRKKGR
jgi:hypothetical protein